MVLRSIKPERGSGGGVSERPVVIADDELDVRAGRRRRRWQGQGDSSAISAQIT